MLKDKGELLLEVRAKAEREREIQALTLFDKVHSFTTALASLTLFTLLPLFLNYKRQETGKFVSAQGDIAERLEEVGLLPVHAACQKMRRSMESKLEEMQSHELEGESLLIKLQNTCSQVSQGSMNLQRDIFSQVSRGRG